MTNPSSCRVHGEFAARRTRSDDEVVAEHCVTCGDDGIEMSIVELDGTGLATCVGPEGPQTVEVGLIESAGPGDRILVHAGTAIATLEAQR